MSGPGAAVGPAIGFSFSALDSAHFRARMRILCASGRCAFKMAHRQRTDLEEYRGCSSPIDAVGRRFLLPWRRVARAKPLAVPPLSRLQDALP